MLLSTVLGYSFRRLLQAGLLVFLFFTVFATSQASAQVVGASPTCAGPGECLCDNSYEDCRTPILNLIRNERVAIDVSFWFMTDWRYSSELIRRFSSDPNVNPLGRIPIRIIVDTQADANYPENRTRRQEFINAGIPIRDCVASGINHWKAMIFHGQGKVQFSAANYAHGSFAPITPYTAYVDEAIYFTDDDLRPDSTHLSIVESFMKKFDDHWVDTTAFTNLANNPVLTRRYPDLAGLSVHPHLNFVPYENFEDRLRALVNSETLAVDAVMFRITSAKIPDALIALHRLRPELPIRLITEERQYRNTTYFWHAYNVDRMYAAGIPIKVKDNVTDQDVHQKSIVLHGRNLAVFGSSNWTSSSSTSQREHNYFSPKAWMVDWFKEQFQRKWNNLRADANNSPIGTTVFIDFVPGYPEPPVYAAPANDTLGVDPNAVTLRWEGGWWAHKYDILLSTSGSTTSSGVLNVAPIVVDYAPGSATAGVRSTKESYTLTGLQPGTQYYWQIRGKTMANRTRIGPVWRFTTTGGVAPPSAPGGLTGTAVSSNRVDLAWNDVAGEEGYRIERKLASATTWAEIATTGFNVITYTNSSGLSPGTSYNYRIRAYNSGGYSTYSNTITVTTPSITLSPSDVVLHAGLASSRVGNWSQLQDSSAAGGFRISNPNAGAATITTPLANPSHYFEMQFTASANTAYRLWMRGQAASNNGYNDSVWVQFSNASNSSGRAINIGTTSAEWVNLQDCSGATLSAWGWQDNGYASSPCGFLGPLIYFSASGTQTIRVQVREDGASFDQIVLSPDTFLNSPPGATRNDTVRLPAQSGGTQTTLSALDVVLHAGLAETTAGRWSVVEDPSAAAGWRLANTDVGAATITTPRAEPLDYFEMHFTVTADRPYRLWMRGQATNNSGYNDSAWVQFSDAVNANGTVINIGTTNAEWVNLQDCSGSCPLHGWGWQDNGYGGLGPLIYFRSSGQQTVRVQVREDGAAFDQIVLSPDTFLSSSPGTTRSDTVILPSQNGS